MGLYSEERKQSVIKKMMSQTLSIPQLSKEEGISDVTLYNWRKQARNKGLDVPGKKTQGEQWSSEARFAVVLETASMNEEELSKYCRQKGLYAEQVADWKRNCLEANKRTDTRIKARSVSQRRDKQRIKRLEKELRRKEKALAETAALLVLRKKYNALWGEGEDE